MLSKYAITYIFQILCGFFVSRPEVAKTEIFKCGVCKMDLDSTWKDTHVNQFPHADLLKLKRETLRKG